MHILVAPDKFRGSLSASEAAEAMAEGIRMVNPLFRVSCLPLADGGEGSLDMMLRYAEGRKVPTRAHDPLFRPIEAVYGLSTYQGGKTAWIEMAQASGIQLLADHERNACLTSSFGTGELIRHALEQGANRVVLMIGGSATNDGGLGILAALGFRFRDTSGNILQPIGQNLSQIAEIDASQVISALQYATFEVVSDVQNPLCGENGATMIFGAQKGLTPQAQLDLEAGMKHWRTVAAAYLQRDVSDEAGAGAAGGVGFAAMAFLQAKMVSGIDWMLDVSGFSSMLKTADLVLTGEGKLDVQTLSGKVVAGITKQAAEHRVPVVALCGTLALSAADIEALGLHFAASILTRPMSLTEAEHEAYFLLRDATSRVIQMMSRFSA